MATLLQFTIGNYRSFHQARTFSMVPNSIQDNPKECVINEGHYKYVTTVAVYGANSSDKSNLVMALDVMSNMVLNSVKLNDHDALDFDPFLLSEDSENQPTHFEIAYLDDEETRVRYGFDYTMKQIYILTLFLCLFSWVGKAQTSIESLADFWKAIQSTLFTRMMLSE